MFSTTTSLLPHQCDAVAKLLPSRVGALYMDMGTGKSRTLIELIKIRAGKFDRIFWLTPCALRNNVLDQLIEHTTIDRSSIAVWDSHTLGNMPDADFHIVGLETIGSSDRAVLLFADLVTENSYVAVDESTWIKGHNANRTRRVIQISAKSKYRTILTGTPFTQGAADLYSQMTFLSAKILGYRSWYSFARNHLVFEEKIGRSGYLCKTGRIMSTHNHGYLANRIAPYTYQVMKDECLSLPGKLYESRSTCMTIEQRQAYDDAKNEILDKDYDEWSSIAIYHLFSTLQGIVCGWWRRTNGDVISLEHNRIDLLQSVLNDIPDTEPVIVWAKYRRSANEIAAHIGEKAVLYTGDVSEKKRIESLAHWRNSKGVLVATQAVGGHGLTLTECAYSIFYADSFKYSERIQAEDRTHRIGQDRRPVYTTLKCSPSIDDRIASALEKKESALYSFRAEVDLCKKQGMKSRAIELVKSL